MSLSPAVQRLLALALLLVLIGLVYAAVVAPYLAYRAEQEARIGQAEQLVRRYRQLLSNRDSLTERAAILDAEREDGSRGYLAGGEPSIAAAELQQSLRAAIEGLDGAIRSMRVLPAAPQGGMVRIGVTSQIAIDHIGLRELFHEIETDGPVLFIDSFQVNDREVRRRRRNQAEPSSEDQLDVTVTVYGFLLGGDA